MRRAFLLCLASLGLASVACAEWPRLPAIEGELAGKFTAPGWASAPAIDWKITVRASEKGQRHAELIADAAGAKLRVQAAFDAATGDGSWRIDAGELDAAVWFPAVAGKLGDPFATGQVSGKIGITGEGALHGGSPAGSIVLALSDAHLALPTQKLEFTGLAIRVVLPQLPALVAKGELSFTAGHVAEFVLSEGRANFALDEKGELNLSDTRVRGLDGELTVPPFHFQVSAPEIALTVKAAGIGLDKVAEFLPSALSEARGRVDGEIAVKWSSAAGLSFGAGWMRLTGGNPATVRLAPSPGLITAQLTVGNPALPALQRVELGQTPLSVKLLSAEFQPAGDASGRTGSVRLEAEPIDPQLIAPLLVDVNVAGPLDQLIKIGLDDRMHVGAPRE